MLESARRLITVPQVPVKVLVAFSAVSGFVWLLKQDLIHPLVIYCLQMYLAF